MQKRSHYFGVVWKKRTETWQGQIVVNGKVVTIPSEATEQWEIASEVKDYVASLKAEGKIVSDTFGKLKDPSQYHGISWKPKRNEYTATLRWDDKSLAFSLSGGDQRQMAKEIRDKVDTLRRRWPKINAKFAQRWRSKDKRLSEDSIKAGTKKPKGAAESHDFESPDTVDNVFSDQGESLDWGVNEEAEGFYDPPPCLGIYPSRSGRGYDCRVVSNGKLRHLCANERAGTCYVALMDELYLLSGKGIKYNPSYGLPLECDKRLDSNDVFAFASNAASTIGPAKIEYFPERDAYKSQFYSDRGKASEILHHVECQSEEECLKIVSSVRRMLTTKYRPPSISKKPTIVNQQVSVLSEEDNGQTDDVHNDRFDVDLSSEETPVPTPLPQNPETNTSKSEELTGVSVDVDIILSKQNQEFKKKLPRSTDVAWIGKEIWVKWDGEREWYRGIVVDIMDEKTISVKYPQDNSYDMVHIRGRTWHWAFNTDDNEDDPLSSEEEVPAEEEEADEGNSSTASSFIEKDTVAKETRLAALEDNDRKIGCYWSAKVGKYYIRRQRDKQRHGNGTATNLHDARLLSDELYLRLTPKSQITEDKLNYPQNHKALLQKEAAKSSESTDATVSEGEDMNSERIGEHGLGEHGLGEHGLGVIYESAQKKWGVKRYVESLDQFIEESGFSSKRLAQKRSDHIYLLHCGKDLDFAKLNFPERVQQSQSKKFKCVNIRKLANGEKRFAGCRTINRRNYSATRSRWALQAAVRSDELLTTKSAPHDYTPEMLNFPEFHPDYENSVASESEEASQNSDSSADSQPPMPEKTIGVSRALGRFRARRKDHTAGKIRTNGTFDDIREACEASDQLYISMSKNPNPVQVNFHKNFPSDWTYLEDCDRDTYGVSFQNHKYYVKRRMKNGKYKSGGSFETRREACLKSDELYKRSEKVNPKKLNYPSLYDPNESEMESAVEESEHLTTEDVEMQVEEPEEMAEIEEPQESETEEREESERMEIAEPEIPKYRRPEEKSWGDGNLHTGWTSSENASTDSEDFYAPRKKAAATTKTSASKNESSSSDDFYQPRKKRIV